MEHTEKTIAGTWYTITCTAAATVTQQIDGETAELATLEKSGTAAFRATASTITIQTEGKYHILPTKAPAVSGISNNSGGDEKLCETLTITPAGTTEDNFNAYGFVCIATLSGKITQLDIECRDNRTAEPVDTPVYVKVWRGTEELLARSTNAQSHEIAATLSYTFEPFAVAAGDELRVTFHTADGMATEAWQMGVRCCLRSVALTEGETGGMLNSAGGYSSTSYTAKYTWHLQVEKYAPITHVGDTSHLTAEQRELLSWLADNKESLAGLVSAAATVENDGTPTETE